MKPEIILDDLGRRYHTHFDRRVFVRVDGKSHQFSFELYELISDCSAINDDALEFADCFGFIYPPATVYNDIYLIPPATFFEIKDSKIFLGDFIEAVSSLNGVSLSHGDLSLYLERRLNEVMAKLPEGYNEAQCLFSAGIDSSVLLGILKKHMRVKGLMCDMPSMPSERNKAISMSIQGDFDVDVITLQNDLKLYVDKAVGLIQEPVYDNAAILLLALVSEAKVSKEKSIVFDGQGADSLFFGLPHNRVFSLYHRFSLVFSNLKFLNFFPRFSRRDTTARRFLYRVRRAADLLFSSSQAEFLIKSLVLPGKEITAFRNNMTFSTMNDDIKRLVGQFSKDHQSAIRALFMLRLLPARELQKYDVLRRAGYNISLPYMRENIVLDMFSYPSNRFIVSGIYKYPVYQICKKLWPGFFDSFSTSPFYHEFSSGSETNILDYTTKKVRSTLAEKVMHDS